MSECAPSTTIPYPHRSTRITEVAYKVFETSIETQSRGLLQIPLDPDDNSVTPPLYILDHAQILKEVMSVYQSSAMDEDFVASEKSNVSLPFSKILDVVLQPVIDSVFTKSEEKAKLRPRWDAKVYIINCLTYIQVCSIKPGCLPQADLLLRVFSSHSPRSQRRSRIILRRFWNRKPQI